MVIRAAEAEAIEKAAAEFTIERAGNKLTAEINEKQAAADAEAAGMPTQPGGGYAASMPGDGPNKVGTHSVTMLGDKGHNWTENVANQADSLRQLEYWADYLIGKNQLG
jgi:hypothetical protein